MKSVSKAWSEIENLAKDGLPSAICLLDMRNQVQGKNKGDINMQALKEMVQRYIATLETGWRIPNGDILSLLQAVEAAL